MKEIDLGKAVVEWLEKEHPEWDVFQEIRPSKYAGTPVADIVCINEDGTVWVIELKKRLNMKVIEQVARWMVDYRSVGILIPTRLEAKNRTWWWLAQLKVKWGIGSIIVDEQGRVAEHKRPDMLDIVPMNNAGFLEVCSEGKPKGFAEAGQKGGGYWTPYKESMIKVKAYIRLHPGCGIGDIVNALGKLHYASTHSARTNLVKMLNSVESDWCEVKRKGTFDTFYVREDAG